MNAAQFRRHVLTPDALEMVDTIARTGSFASAARELGKVPSALTYNVRQLEEALDVLLFDRSSRQARLTPAGQELVLEGRRLLTQMDAVANRVQRVASGWETQLTIAIDGIVSHGPVFDMIEAFQAMSPPTRLKIRNEVLSGTWEALNLGLADLALGLGAAHLASDNIRVEVLGDVEFVFVVAPHHALARQAEPLSAETMGAHRIVAVADSTRGLDSMTIGILPGQDVLTVASMHDKIEAIRRNLGCGFVPSYMVQNDVEAGKLVKRQVAQPPRIARTVYAWRQVGPQPGNALAWWLKQLGHAHSRQALLSTPCKR